LSNEYPEKKDLAQFVEYVCSFAGSGQIPPAMGEYALDLRDMLQEEDKTEYKRDGAGDIRQAYKINP
jgi:hypothetical protein